MKISHIAIVFFMTALLGGCGEKTKNNAPSSAIKQGQTVRFSGGFGCVTKDSFRKLLQKTAGSGSTAAAPSSMPPDCVALPHATNFRVLGVEEQAGHVEITVTNSHNLGNSGGLWTDPKFIAS